MKKLFFILLLCIPIFLIGAEHDIITTDASDIYFTGTWNAPAGEYINHFHSEQSTGQVDLVTQSTGGSEKTVILCFRSDVWFVGNWTAPGGVYIIGYSTDNSGGYLTLNAELSNGDQQMIMFTNCGQIYFGTYENSGEWHKGFTSSSSGGWLSLTAITESANQPPNTPSTPSGPTAGEAGISYSYSTSTTDPDGDQVKYTFDWGDGDSTVTGFYASGATANASHTWASAGTYNVKVKATDSNGSTSSWSSSLPVNISPANQPPNTPSTPSGPTVGEAGISYGYSTSTTDPDGDQVKYTFDWGDGDSTVTGFYASGATANASHTWASAGTYNVRVKATDSNGSTSSWSSSLPVNISLANQPPNTPSTPSGATNGNTSIFYQFSTVSTDPEGNDIYYIFDWNDGNQTQTGLLQSGDSCIFAHSWTTPNSYSIKVKAVDEFGAESDWSSTVNIMISEISFSSDWDCYTNSEYSSGSAMEWDALWVATTGGIVRWNISDSTNIKYTTVNGLSDNAVKDIFVDNDGNKWFGTKEGVTMYDGSDWITYNTSNSGLPDNIVYAITQDNDGNYWFGTGNGCAKFDGTTWTAHINLGGVTNVAVRGIAVDTLNHIWTANNPHNFGDPGGVSMYDGSAWTNWDLDGTTWQDNYLLSLATDGKNRVWAGTWLKWVYMYDGSTWTHYDDINSGLLGQQVEAINVESDTIIWFANHRGSSATNDNSGITKYDGLTWTNYTPNNSGLNNKMVFSITIDTLNNHYYFGLVSGGVDGFDGVSAWNNYKRSNELHCNYITCIDISSDNIKYFGTSYYGIAVLNNGTWSNYWSGNSGLGDDYVNCLHIDSGDTLWVGTQYSGFYKFNGSTWTNYDTTNSGLLGNIILSLDKSSDNVLWIGTSGWDGPYGQNGALCRYDGSSWTNYCLENSGIIDDDGFVVKVDKGDTVWIGTEEGISKFYNGSWTNYTTANGLVNDHILSIAIDSLNNKWFGTNGGISKFNGTSWTNWTTSEGLPSNIITGMSVDDSGMVWISTSNGAAVYNGCEWIAYSQADSLVDNDLTSIATDKNNHVWFGSNDSGIGKFSGITLAFVEEDRNTYSAKDKIFSISLNPFHERTVIKINGFDINRDTDNNSKMKLKIYNINGRLVRDFSTQLANNKRLPFEITWDGTDSNGRRIPTGQYFACFEYGNFKQTAKLILIK